MIMNTRRLKNYSKAGRFFLVVFFSATTLCTAQLLTSCSQIEVLSYLVIYRADENGNINGKARVLQAVMAGSATSCVTAIPANGYRFVRWDDGNTNPVRVDSEVYASFERIAYFAAEETPDAA